MQAILDGLNELGGCPDDYLPEGQTCALPMIPGTYGGEPALEIVLPEIDSTIGGLLSNGKFYGQIKFTVDGSTFACVWVRVQVA